MSVLQGFKRTGGVELAPMSATRDRNIADAYANGRKQGGVNVALYHSICLQIHISLALIFLLVTGLLFKYSTKGKSRGVLIDFLSIYPKEKASPKASH